MCDAWTLRTLDELAVYHNGRAFKPSDWSDAGLPIIRIAQITNPDARPNHYDGQDIDARHLVDSGDLLFSWSATLAVMRWKKGPAVLNQHIFKVVEKTGVSKEFLRHLLDYSLPSLAERSHGSTMKHIRKGVLREHRVLTPPLPEQRKIAAILSSVDEAMEKTQTVIDQVKVVKRGLMQELFTRGPPGRHIRFKQTEIGKIPVSWSVLSLASLCEDGIRNGVFKKRAEFGFGVRLINVSDVYRNLQVDPRALQRVNVTVDEMDRFSARCGDLFFVRSSLKKEGIGKCCVVTGTCEPLVFECHIMRVRVRTAEADSLFLAYQCDTSGFRRRLMRQAKTVTMTTIGQTGLGSLPVACPAVDEQREISDILVSLDRRVETENRRTARLERVKAALMSVLLTGELRVTPDPEPK